MRYVGIDLAPGLIDFAKKNDTLRNHHYLVGDITDVSLDLAMSLLIAQPWFWPYKM